MFPVKLGLCFWWIWNVSFLQIKHYLCESEERCPGKYRYFCFDILFCLMMRYQGSCSRFYQTNLVKIAADPLCHATFQENQKDQKVGWVGPAIFNKTYNSTDCLGSLGADAGLNLLEFQLFPSRYFCFYFFLRIIKIILI